MGNHVDPSGPGVRNEPVDDLPRVEDRRGRVPQERRAAILLRLPKRPAPRVPFLLDAFVERIVIVRDVAISELLVVEEPSTISDNEEC
jgi:hypothetical protein